MSLYKRGEVWHYDFTVNRKRERGSTGFKKKADAAEYVEQLRRTLKLGTTPDRPPVTLGKAADQWFRAKIADKKTATTVAQRLKILFRHIERTTPVGQIGAREIEEAMIARSVEKTRQGRLPTASTINRDMIDTTLRPILAYAEEAMEEAVKRIKWAKLRRQEPKGRTRSFTGEEIATWREALPDWHRPVFDFIGRYGPRLQEAFFAPEAYDPNTGEIKLTDTKNGLDHVIVLLDEDIGPMNARWARAVAAKLDTVWFREEGGKLYPIHWRAFQSASKAALEKAEIANARPVHDLRHHAATTLYRATGNIKLVQDLLNHQTVASSARYSHTNKADLKAAMRHAHATKSGAPDTEASRINALTDVGRGT